MGYSDNVLKLDELEAQIEKGNILWEVDNKQVRAWNLWNRHGRVAVARSLVPAGASFPNHVHDEVESLTCFDGEGFVVFINKDRSEKAIPIKAGSVIHVQEGQAHRIEATTDLWFIAVTVPASPGFPE